MTELKDITFKWPDILKFISWTSFAVIALVSVITRLDRIESNIAINNAMQQGVNDSQNERMVALQNQINDMKSLADRIDPKCLKPKYYNHY